MRELGGFEMGIHMTNVGRIDPMTRLAEGLYAAESAMEELVIDRKEAWAEEPLETVRCLIDRLTVRTNVMRLAERHAP